MCTRSMSQIKLFIPNVHQQCTPPLCPFQISILKCTHLPYVHRFYVPFQISVLKLFRSMEACIRSTCNCSGCFVNNLVSIVHFSLESQFPVTAIRNFGCDYQIFQKLKSFLCHKLRVELTGQYLVHIAQTPWSGGYDYWT